MCRAVTRSEAGFRAERKDIYLLVKQDMKGFVSWVTWTPGDSGDLTQLPNCEGLLVHPCTILIVSHFLNHIWLLVCKRLHLSIQAGESNTQKACDNGETVVMRRDCFKK